MPTNQFLNLEEEKQNRIIQAAIAEFSQYGYENASTNRIVKACEISKGSLFKYFLGKEELYLFILDVVTTEYTDALMREIKELSTDLFERIKEYSVREFTWYAKQPQKAKLILDAFKKDGNDLYFKITERYEKKELDIYFKCLEGMNDCVYSCDKQMLSDILRWFLKGFNEDFMNRIQGEQGDFETMKNLYIEKLSAYLEIVKYGLLKDAQQ